MYHQIAYPPPQPLPPPPPRPGPSPEDTAQKLLDAVFGVLSQHHDMMNRSFEKIHTSLTNNIEQLRAQMAEVKSSTERQVLQVSTHIRRATEYQVESTQQLVSRFDTLQEKLVGEGSPLVKKLSAIDETMLELCERLADPLASRSETPLAPPAALSPIKYSAPVIGSPYAASSDDSTYTIPNFINANWSKGFPLAHSQLAPNITHEQFLSHLKPHDGTIDALRHSVSAIQVPPQQLDPAALQADIQPAPVVESPLPSSPPAPPPTDPSPNIQPSPASTRVTTPAPLSQNKQTSPESSSTRVPLAPPLPPPPPPHTPPRLEVDTSYPDSDPPVEDPTLLFTPSPSPRVKLELPEQFSSSPLSSLSSSSDENEIENLLQFNGVIPSSVSPSVLTIKLHPSPSKPGGSSKRSALSPSPTSRQKRRKTDCELLPVGSKVKTRWPAKVECTETSGRWIECDRCKTWYHYGCVGIKKASKKFSCPPCQAGGQCKNGTGSSTTTTAVSTQQPRAKCGREDCTQPVTEDEFFISRIIGRSRDRRTLEGPYMWLVEWDGYPVSDATWQEEASLPDPAQLIRKFNKAVRDAGLHDDSERQLILPQVLPLVPEELLARFP